MFGGTRVLSRVAEGLKLKRQAKMIHQSAVELNDAVPQYANAEQAAEFTKSSIFSIFIRTITAGYKTKGNEHCHTFYYERFNSSMTFFLRSLMQAAVLHAAAMAVEPTLPTNAPPY